MLRHMRTTAELRAAEAARVDKEPFRPARRKLPTLWDDFFRRTQRSWKKFRKTRWKSK
jgi:hypothetical protein